MESDKEAMEMEELDCEDEIDEAPSIYIGHTEAP